MGPNPILATVMKGRSLSGSERVKGTRHPLFHLDQSDARKLACTMQHCVASGEPEMDEKAGTLTVGTRCKLLRPIRDREGRARFAEQPEIVRELTNLERQMYLVKFSDGNTTFVFPDEVVST
jgi:hypothetical protein